MNKVVVLNICEPKVDKIAAETIVENKCKIIKQMRKYEIIDVQLISKLKICLLFKFNSNSTEKSLKPKNMIF